MDNKNRWLKIILTRGIAPGLYICLSKYFAGEFDFQIFRFILGILLMALPSFFLLSFHVICISYITRTMREGIRGFLWVIFLIILMSLRLVGYGKFESVMPFIIKMVTASLIIIFVERKILKLSYDKYYS